MFSVAADKSLGLLGLLTSNALSTLRLLIKGVPGFGVEAGVDADPREDALWISLNFGLLTVRLGVLRSVLTPGFSSSAMLKGTNLS